MSPKVVNENRPNHCEDCPFKDRLTVGGYGNKESGIVLVGEAPGKNEAVWGKPFVGQSGNLLRATLKAVDIGPEDVYMTNTCKCWPPGNKITSAAIRACRSSLIDEINELQPEKILMIGANALKAITGNMKAKITQERGRGLDLGGIYGLPTLHPAFVLRAPDLFRDFGKDVQKFFTASTVEKEPVIDRYTVQSIEELNNRLLLFSNVEALSCDLETTGLNAYKDTIIRLGIGVIDEDKKGISISVPSEILNTDEGKAAIFNTLTNWDNANPDRVWAFFNYSFDIQLLRSLFDNKFFTVANAVDVMLMNYLIDERSMGTGSDEENTPRKGYSIHSLKTLARVYYDASDFAFDWDTFYNVLANGTDEEIDKALAELDYYLGYDCYYTIRLYYDLKEKLEKDSPRFWSLLTKDFTPSAEALAGMQLEGARIDIPYLEEKQIEVAKTVEELKAKCQELAIELTKDNMWVKEGEWQEFNPNSPKQVAELLYDDMGLLPIAKKGRTTEKIALQEIIRDQASTEEKELINAIIDFRMWHKIGATFIKKFILLADTDSRIRTNFLLHGTKTGRLSSQKPNLQNVPKIIGPLIRNAFVASPDHYLLEADYSQLELRVAAYLSKDPPMTQAFINGEDIHGIVAQSMFNRSAEEVTEAERVMAKTVNFGVLYGRTAEAMTQGQEVKFMQEVGGHGWTLEEADKFIQRFQERYFVLNAWNEEQKAEMMKERQLDTIFGRRMRFPFLPARYIGHAERQAINFPIQSAASDICRDAIVRLWHNHLPSLGGVRMILTVHDSILIEMHKHTSIKVLHLIRREMEDNVPIEDTEIPFPVDMKLGTRWGELKSFNMDRHSPEVAIDYMMRRQDD